MLNNWKQRIDRNKRYMQFIRELPCVICGKALSDPHHSETGGMGTKSSDLTCIPLCRIHHTEVHTIGKYSFQQKHDIDFRDIRILCLEGYIRIREPREDGA